MIILFIISLLAPPAMGYWGRRNWGPFFFFFFFFFFWEPRADKCYPFKAWNRSEYSHACSIHCREFHPCLHFYLLGPFTFIFCSVITILLKITPVYHSRHWFSSSLQSVRKLRCKPCGQLDIKQRSTLIYGGRSQPVSALRKLSFPDT